MRRLPSKQTRAGLSLLEVLIAIAIVGVIAAAFTAVLVRSLKQNTVSGARTEAVQLVNYLGRRVLGGDTAVTPLPPATSRSWGYGQLTANFPDLPRQRGFADPDLYRADVTLLGNQGLFGTVVASYQLQVCWASPEGEICVGSETLAPRPLGPGGPAPSTPAIN